MAVESQYEQLDLRQKDDAIYEDLRTMTGKSKKYTHASIAIKSNSK